MSRIFSLFNDYLTALGVPHTDGYSERRFETMPFHTLFGLSELLEEYGVRAPAYTSTTKRNTTRCRCRFWHRRGEA